MEYRIFERRLLRLVFGSNCPLAPVHVAYYVGVSVAEARVHLDAMTSAGVLELDSSEDGHIVYKYPLRPPLDTLPDPKRLRRPRRPDRNTSIRVQNVRTPVGPAVLLSVEAPRYSPATAAALSFFLPGVGQIYSGRVPQGVGWFFATTLGYLMFLVPGLILHICCVVNAAAVPTPLPTG